MAKRRREIVSNLNLTPFIDLISTLIIFLLFTSVWEHLAAVPVSMGSSDTTTVQVPSPSDAKKVDSKLKVTISGDDVVLFDAGKTTRFTRSELLGNEFSQVEAFAAAARGKYVDRKDVVISITDEAVYSDIVLVMDKFLAADFDQLVVMGANL